MKNLFKFSKSVLSFKEGQTKALPYSTTQQLTFYGYGEVVKQGEEKKKITRSKRK